MTRPARRPRLTTLERTVLRLIRSARPDLLLPYVSDRPVVNIDGTWVMTVDDAAREVAEVYLEAARRSSRVATGGYRVPVVIYRGAGARRPRVLLSASLEKLCSHAITDGRRRALVTIDVSLPDFLNLIPPADDGTHEFHLENETLAIA